MDFDNMMNNDAVNFGDMHSGQFLLGLLSAFDNKYQACADSFFKEITWKQFFAIICINLCKEAPTINELAEVMGSSHQNVKQILLKLEKIGFVSIFQDEKDKRKQRIVLTEKCRDFCMNNESASQDIIGRMFAGIDEENLITTIKTVLAMEHNIDAIVNEGW